MIDDLELLLHDGHAAGKVVMLANLARELGKLGLGDGLRAAVADEHAEQREPDGDKRGDDGLRHGLLLICMDFAGA